MLAPAFRTALYRAVACVHSLWRNAVLTAAACVILAAGGCGGRQETHERVRIGGEEFVLELALDADARATGLMHRATIEPGTGMLFVFPDADVKVQSFWMGYCETDIDLIYADSRGYVTAVHEMKKAEPRREGESEEDYRQRLPVYPSGASARFAIELPPGSIRRLGIAREQRLELDVERLKALAR